MRRRCWLRLLGAAAAVGLLCAHSPYRQWDVYRRSRLVLLVSSTDEASVRQARALVDVFVHRLPGSRATLARARDHNDLARLLASKQIEVAFVTEAEAHAMMVGADPYADNGGIALRTLAAVGSRLLVCLEDVPAPAAHLLVEALAEGWRDLDPQLVPRASGPAPSQALRVPLHAGARDHYHAHR